MNRNTPSEPASDPLAELLRRADAASPPPPFGDDLAGRVRVRFRRRRQVRRVAGASAFGFVFLIAMFAIVRFASRPVPAPQLTAVTPLPTTLRTSPVVVEVQDPKVLVAEMRRARAEADARLAFTKRVLAAERHRFNMARLNEANHVPEPLRIQRIAMLRDEAALTLIGQAEGLKTRAQSPLDALATYRRAMELFPDTPAAAVARQRLSELESRIRNEEIPS